MVTARRASGDADATAEAQVTSVARRRAGGLTPKAVRIAIAALASTTVFGLVAGVALLPADGETAVQSETTQRSPGSTSLGTSRSLTRQPLASTSATPAALPTASVEASAAAAPTKAKPTAEPSTKKQAEKKTAKKVKAAKAEAKKAKPKTPDYDELKKKSESLYAESAVNVRTGPGAGYDVVDTLSVGEKIMTTTWEVDGWRQVSLDSEAGWIKESFLTDDEPEPEAEEAASDGGYSTAACSKAGDLEAHLTATAGKVLRTVCAKFPAVSSFGGYRPGAGSYHGSGRAIDIMISGEAGWDIANWARANAGSLGVIEVIYQQQIWTTQRSGDGWRGMSDRGSTSANHYDHVHLSIKA